MPDVSEPSAFTPLRREPKLADKVADTIRESILSRQLKPGDALPSERELSQQFGVSRTVIREAIRSLAGKGLVKAMAGSGIRVLAVDADTVGESMRDLVESTDFDYTKVDEIRQVLEVAAAGFAAERATAEDIDVIGQALGAMAEHLDDLEACVQADLAFHRAIAIATHNELFLMLHDSLGGSLIDVRRRNLGRGRARRQRVVAAHRDILDGLILRDPGVARQMMSRHLGEVRAAWGETTA
jgi:GntR family transcriptional repressor for pyruvate dehydrogenase complex